VINVSAGGTVLGNITISNIGVQTESENSAGVQMLDTRPFTIRDVLVANDAGKTNMCIFINSTGGSATYCQGDIHGCYLSGGKFSIVLTNEVTDMKIFNNSIVGNQDPVVADSVGVVVGSTAGPGMAIAMNQIDGWKYGLRQYSGEGVRFHDNRLETVETSIVRWESGARRNSAMQNYRSGTCTLPYDNQDTNGDNVYWSQYDGLTIEKGSASQLSLGFANNTTSGFYLANSNTLTFRLTGTNFVNFNGNKSTIELSNSSLDPSIRFIGQGTQTARIGISRTNSVSSLAVFDDSDNERLALITQATSDQGHIRVPGRPAAQPPRR
jgi:hypothetical protein